MASLLAAYASSDEGSPPPSSTTAVHHDDSDDDKDLLKQAQSDAFNFAGLTSSAGPSTDSRRELAVMASAPEVLSEDVNNQTSLIMRPTDKVMNVNISYADMSKPVLGPENPWDTGVKGMNTIAGHVEEHSMDAHSFRTQQKSFTYLGYAADPSAPSGSTHLVGDLSSALEKDFANVDNVKVTKSQKKAAKRKRAAGGDLETVEGEGAYEGPWAGYKVEEEVGEESENEEDKESWRVEKKRRDEEAEKAKEKRKVGGEEKSIFHGKSLTDYAGRTYMHVPTDKGVSLSADAPPPDSFLPKECIHTFVGHKKGVSSMKLFPGSGHLLLTGSMDTTVKLWDVYNEGNCLRTFMGHGQAVKDVAFNNSGTRFLTASYDRQVKLWDTESGACLRAFTTGKRPHVVKFHPDEDKQNTFLVGMQDKKIIQFDTDSGSITQEYDMHLGPVNTITFVDDNRRFVTTSDDKSIRAWDFDVPVNIKSIAEPDMHSIPAITLHPNGKAFAGQSLDNQILIWSTDGFRQNRKKRFAGHTTAGYACSIGFSPDGRYISSGDASGNVVFWDYAKGKLIKRLKAHKEVVIDHLWLPHESSKLLTASWDGLVKLWD